MEECYAPSSNVPIHLGQQDALTIQNIEKTQCQSEEVILYICYPQLSQYNSFLFFVLSTLSFFIKCTMTQTLFVKCTLYKICLNWLDLVFSILPLCLGITNRIWPKRWWSETAKWWMWNSPVNRERNNVRALFWTVALKWPYLTPNP